MRPLAGLRPLVRDGVLRALWAAGVTRPESRARGRLTIVTFHRVLPPAERALYPMPNLVVTPEVLRWTLQELVRGYDCGPLAETFTRWRNGAGSDRPLLAVTFDDGQWDNFAYAQPVLDELRLRATFFVPAGLVGTDRLIWHDSLGFAAARLAETRGVESAARALGLDQKRGTVASLVFRLVTRAKDFDSRGRQSLIELAEKLAASSPSGSPAGAPPWARLMSWDELRQLARAGHEVGSHSLTHPLLPQCDDAVVEREVASSKRLLEERLGAPVLTFCYPNGDCDDRGAAAARRAGYLCAVTTGRGLNGPDQDAMKMQRIDVEAEHVVDRRNTLYDARLAFRLSGLWPPGSGVGGNARSAW